MSIAHSRSIWNLSLLIISVYDLHCLSELTQLWNHLSVAGPACVKNTRPQDVQLVWTLLHWMVRQRGTEAQLCHTRRFAIPRSDSVGLSSMTANIKSKFLVATNFQRLKLWLVPERFVCIFLPVDKHTESTHSFHPHAPSALLGLSLHQTMASYALIRSLQSAVSQQPRMKYGFQAQRLTVVCCQVQTNKCF